jgi:hypothetical protein
MFINPSIPKTGDLIYAGTSHRAKIHKPLMVRSVTVSFIDLIFLPCMLVELLYFKNNGQKFFLYLDVVITDCY